MRSAECRMRNCRASVDRERGRRIRHCHSALRIPHSALFPALLVLWARAPTNAQSLPPLPDTTGLGAHVLPLARAPANAPWVGPPAHATSALRLGAARRDEMNHPTAAAAP